MESLLGLVRHNGNAALLEAVEMSLLSTLYGVPLHLHAEGLRGTGKTSIFRAARRVLPRIRRVKGCLYNCDPTAPHCPQHHAMDPEQLGAVGTEWVPMPFLEISHSAKVGTVVGSIDLGRLVHAEEPAAAMLPGTLPQAHRGVVFVDEINRLAETSPELADVLLDAMGTKPGRVQIEETGLAAVELPLTVSVWAASNPDEDPGPLEEIRRQLSDRFDFVIPTTRPGEPAVVAQILALFDGAPAGAAAAMRAAARPASAEAVGLELYRTRLADRARTLAGVEVPPWLRAQVADLYARFGLESLRAAQAMLWGIRLRAGLEERPAAAWADLAAVAPLALHHRVDGETLGRLLQHVRALQARGDRPAAADEAVSAGAPGGPRPGAGLAGQAALPAALPDPDRGGPGGGTPGVRERCGGWPGGSAAAADAPFRPGEPDGAADHGRLSIWDWVRSNLLGRFGDGAPRPPGADAGHPGGRTGGSASARPGLRPGVPADPAAIARTAGGLFQRPAPAGGNGATGSLRPGSAAGMRGGAGAAAQAGAPGSRGSAGHQPGAAAAPAGAAETGPGGTPGDGSGAGGGQGAPARLADPTRVAATAPPVAARRLTSLPVEDWVRTEPELDGGSQRWTGSPS